MTPRPTIRHALAAATALVALIGVSVALSSGGSSDTDELSAGGATLVEIAAEAGGPDPTAPAVAPTSTTASTSTTAAPTTTVAPSTTPPTTSPPPTTAPSTTAAAPPPPPATTPPPPMPTPQPTVPPPPPATAADYDAGCESTMIDRINATRAHVGLPALTVDGGILSVPRNWSAHMAATESLAHNPAFDSLIALLRSWRIVGENVGYASDLSQMYSMFVDSPAHYANIVSPDFTRVSVGCVLSPDGVYWVTQNFWG